MPTPEARAARRRTYIGVALIVSSFALIVTGLQMWMYQQQQDRDDADAKHRVEVERARVACIQTWGQELIDTVQTRTGEHDETGTLDVEAAEQARDNALDDALLLLRADTNAPPPSEDAVQKAARRYYQAIADLREVREQTRQTRADNPYPELEC